MQISQISQKESSDIPAANIFRNSRRIFLMCPPQIFFFKKFSIKTPTKKVDYGFVGEKV